MQGKTALTPRPPLPIMGEGETCAKLAIIVLKFELIDQ